MSEASSSDSKKSIERDEEATGQLPATTGDSDETSPSLSDMPIGVVGLIIEKLNYKHQLTVRKVSKSLRALVDRQKPACESIRFHCCDEFVCMNFNEQRVMYKYDYEPLYYIGIVVIREDFEKAALDDLASSLKNPKLQLEELRVCFRHSRKKDNEKYCNEIRKTLECLNHQVSVKEINLQGSSPSCLLSILPYFKPGVLEKISLGNAYKDWSSDSSEIDQIARSEQWKQAKELRLRDPFDIFPMEYATHFKGFRFFENHIDRNKFILIKDYLSKLDNFEQCTLRTWKSHADLIEQFMGAPVSSNTTEKVFHHSIPDSDCFFEIKKSTDFDVICFHITKKKRESDRYLRCVE